MPVPDGVEKAFLFYLYQELTFLVYCLQVLRLAYITLAIRCVLQELAILAEVALRERNRAERLYDQQAVVLGIKIDLVDGAAGHYNIVAIAEGYLPVLCFKCTGTFVYEEDFVCVGILIKNVGFHAGFRGGKGELYIVVEKYHFTTFQIIGFRVYFKTFEAAVF